MGKFQLNKKGEDPLKIYEDVFKIANDTVETHLGKLGKMPKPISESKASEGSHSHYADYFDQAYYDRNDENPITGYKQCDYCDSQFREYDDKGMIDHANSRHNADLDPNTGEKPNRTFPSWDLSGESKASEIGMHGGDGASFYDGKTFTCDKCGKVGNSFSDMAQEECPADVNANHQIPIFGDMKKEAYAQEDDLDTLMWDNENPDDKDKQWKDKKGKKERKYPA